MVEQADKMRINRLAVTHGNVFWVSVFLLSFYLLTTGAGLYTSDGVAMYRTTAALADHRSFKVEADAGIPQIIAGVDAYYSTYDPGQPLLSVPFYGMGSLLAALFPSGDRVALTVLFVSFLPLVATVSTGIILYQLASFFYTDKRVSTLVVLVWAVFTLAWPYSKFYFPEALITFFLTLAFYKLCATHQLNSRDILWIATALGFAITIRVSSAIYVIPFFIGILLSLRSGSERVRALFIFGLSLSPFLGIVLLHNYIRFHDLFHSGYAGQLFNGSIVEGLYGFLLSSGRSMFLYSPFLLLSFAFFGRFIKKWRIAGFTAAFVLVVALLFFSSWWAWYGGWSWGPRFLVPLLPMLIIPLGIFFQRMTSRFSLTVFGLFLLFSFVAVFPGAAVDFNDYFVAVLQGDYARESLIWFDPAFSPISQHWIEFLSGRSIIFEVSNLSSYGMPRFLDIVLPVLLCGMLCISACMVFLTSRSVPIVHHLKVEEL